MTHDELQAALNAMGAEDWEAGFYGDTIICPEHDNEIELDGSCPHGCGNPISEAGLI